MHINKKVGLRILQVLAVFITVVILCAFSLAWYWKPSVANAIRKNIETSTNNLYSVAFKDIHINFLTGNFSIDSLRLKPNVPVYHQLYRKNEAPIYLFSIIIKKLEIKNTHPFDFYFNKKLSINQLQIEKPIITAYYNAAIASKNKLKGNKFQHPYELIKNSMQSLNIKNIQLKNITLCLQIDSVSKKQRQHIFLSDFYVKNLNIDAQSAINHKAFYADDVGLTVRDFSYTSNDSLYRINFEEYSASSASKGFNVYNLNIVPVRSESNFCDDFGFQKTRYEFAFKRLHFSNFNFEEFIYLQKFHADVLTVEKMKCKIHLNKSFEINPYKERKFPQQIPFDINFPVTIKNINIVNGDINYSEKLPANNLRWDFSFKETNGSVTNFSNELNQIKKNNLLKVNLAFMLNNEAKTALNLGLYYGDSLRSFYCNGEMGGYNLSKLNAILNPLAKIEIANCKLQQLKIGLKGNKIGLDADISMKYKNLRVRVLEFDNREKQVKHHKLYSFLANVMVLSNDNPSVYGNFVHPQFYLKRKPQQGFFNLVWKSILKGCKESIGYSEQVERELKQRSIKYKSLNSKK